MLFELIGGNHEQDGKKYVRGDRIETNLNLVSMFRGKFRKVHPDEPLPEMKGSPDIPVKASSQKAESGADPGSVLDSAEVEASSVRLGPEVTVSFPEAKNTSFRIHIAGSDKYHLVTKEGDIVSTKPFTRNETVIYLKNNA